MPLWYDGNNRRGGLSAADFQTSVTHIAAILEFLGSTGASTAAAVAAGVTGLDTRRATSLLDALVAADAATVATGTYTRTLT